MSQAINSITVCGACLQPRDDINDEGLCAHCELWNDSLDGTLLELIAAQPRN